MQCQIQHQQCLTNPSVVFVVVFVFVVVIVVVIIFVVGKS